MHAQQSSAVNNNMRAQEFTESLRTENPCWKGYHPVGTKKKAGRTVPNCVPTNENSVDDLEQDLKHPDSYKAIDHMMQTIARKYNISAKQLHDKFVEKHGVIPDNWSKEQLDELTFLGSECTKDCSGHRAGYAWSQRKPNKIPNSHSPSFNKGAALQRSGK